MKVEQINQITRNAIDRLREALDRGDSEQLSKYLAAMAQFYRYSWHNVMLIMSQKPNATRVAGFQTWRKLGRFVKKGEKGILILAPMILRTNATDEKLETEQPSP